MTISEERKMHGFIIGELVKHCTTINNVSLSVQENTSRSAYICHCFREAALVSEFGVFVKLSNKRRSPWRYNFFREHQNEIDELKINCNEVFIILVNGDDGVACFNYETLKVLLDDFHEDQEWISVKRGLREQYAIAGKDGQLPFKLASSSFPSVITDFIQTSGFGESNSHDRNKAWYKVW